MNAAAHDGLQSESGRAIETVVAILGLIWLTSALQSPVSNLAAQTYPWVGWGLKLLRFGIYFVPIAILLRDPRHFVSALRPGWPVLSLVLFVALSTWWSIRPMTTLSGAVLLGTTTLFGLFLGLRFDRRRQLFVLGVAFGLVAVGSAIAGASLPDYAVMKGRYEGAWTGLYGHRNLLARDMALAAPLFAVLARERILRPGLAWTLSGICLGLIVASGSRTGGVVAVACFATLLLLPYSSDAVRPRWSRLVAASVGLVGAVALAHPLLLRALDRSTTLTGRTELWSVVVGQIGNRPWFGHGYDAFWIQSKMDGGPAIEVEREIGFLAAHAHNGFLDVTLDLGLIGLSLLAIPLLGVAWRVVRDLRAGSREVGWVWPGLFLVYWLLSNLTESPLVRYDRLGWPLYVALVVSVSHVGTRAADPGGAPVSAGGSEGDAAAD